VRTELLGQRGVQVFGAAWRPAKNDAVCAMVIAFRESAFCAGALRG